MFHIQGDNTQMIKSVETKGNNPGNHDNLLLPQGDKQNLGGYENETLELHDYVNLQECHEMMNMLPLTEFQPQQQTDNNTLSRNDKSSAVHQNGVYCNSCKKR